MANPVTSYSQSYNHLPSRPVSARKGLNFGDSTWEPGSGVRSVQTPSSECSSSAASSLSHRKINIQTTPTKLPEFFEDNSTQVYRPDISPGGTVHLPVPQEEPGPRLYTIFNKHTGQAYVGATTQTPARRIATHAALLSNPENPGSGPVHKELSKNASDIRVAYFDRLSPSQNLAEVEREQIALIPDHLRLNANSGGGGGVSLAVAEAAARTRSDLSLEEQVFVTTPDKQYPFYEDENKMIRCALTPGAMQAQAGIYSITGPDGTYIGQTGRPISVRIGEHASLASRQEPGRGKWELACTIKTKS